MQLCPPELPPAQFPHTGLNGPSLPRKFSRSGIRRLLLHAFTHMDHLTEITHAAFNVKREFDAGTGWRADV